MALQFKLEWEDEPRVRDPLLRATWARLELNAGPDEAELCLTECLGRPSRSLRRGVYGSAFPLARWVVENWWSLLDESLCMERFRGGRSLAGNARTRPWVQRHCLLAAREGFALPDLTIYRDAAFTVLRAVSDPFDQRSAFPVCFVTDAEIRLPVADAKVGLGRLVEVVADRIRGQGPADSPEVKEFLGNWEAVRESGRTEADLCMAAATMGLDPYDPVQLTEELADILQSSFQAIAPAARLDLAESTSGSTLPIDLGWVEQAAAILGINVKADSAFGLSPGAGAEPAHQFGYKRAQWFRERFGVPPNVDDLEGFIGERCGWNPNPVAVAASDGVADRISALVGPNGGGRPLLATPTVRGVSINTRFLLSRALFFTADETVHTTPRLITWAASWPQRASRAFAAELLAPAEELSRRVAGAVTYEQVGELARAFQVSEMVIEHQLENHNLARIVDL
jgi:hypothetical protein